MGVKMLRITMSRYTFGLILVILIIIIGFVIYELKYFSSPLLFGIDGPYYYIQVANLLNTGYLKYPDPPLAFYALAGFSIITGDVVIGIKIGSVLLSLLGALALYFLIKEIGDVISGVVSAIIYIFSSALIKMVFDLIKNAIGITPLMASLLFTYLALKKRKIHYSIIANALIIITCLIHILDFGVLALFTILMTIVVFIEHRNDLKFILPQAIITILLIVIGLAVVPGIVGGDLSKGISFINELLTNKGITNVLRGQQGIFITIYPLLVGIAGLILSMRFSGYRKYFIFIISLIIIGLSIPVIPGDFLWRFNLVALILTSPILSLFISVQREFKTKIALVTLILGIVIPQFISQAVVLKPSISEAEYRELEALVQITPPNAYFVVPNIKVKYWVEILTPKVVRRPSAEIRKYPLIFVVEIHSPEANKLKSLIPPFAKLLFKGKFIEAYIVHPR